MCLTQFVLALLALYVGLAHCFSWDIVLGSKTELHFYDNGTLTHSEEIPSNDLYAIIYDPIHNRVLFSYNTNASTISSFDIATRKIQTLVEFKSGCFIRKFAYDPVTETLFPMLSHGIFSFPLKPGSNNTVDNVGDLIIDLYLWVQGIAVDSCRGYIYWSTHEHIERARFDGSEREVIVDGIVAERADITIDQQTQKMYWIELRYVQHYIYYIESADLNGENRKTLYSESTYCYSGSITVSKDFIYWRSLGVSTYWKLPKNPPEQLPIAKPDFCKKCDSMAANYQVEDQTQGSRTCEALTNLLPSISSNCTADFSLLCVHGRNVIGESACNCTHGYTGERCDVSVCQNYCLQGECSVSAEGQPKCRCDAGYVGERCEVDACHKHCLNNGVCSMNKESQPVCQCTENYEGERCDVSACQDYCFEGNCSVSVGGQPKCRCNAGYSGKRCEVNACQGYCFNNGICSMNEESEPVCQCTGDYEDERCEVSVSVFLSKCYRIAPTLSSLRDILNADEAPDNLNKEVLQLLAESHGACALNEPGKM